ncbi:MAG: Fic family protein [Kiritimatiellia bacterium]|nr:Fic family protein [Lentisphaerota bacterium]
MKTPQIPPDFGALLKQTLKTNRIEQVLRLADLMQPEDSYLHWDELRRRPARKGFSHEEWWLALKLKRRAAYKQVPLLDKDGTPFSYFTTDVVQELLHGIDSGAGGFIGIPEPVTNAQTRDRYVISSLIEEAITSSQLEGAAATREVAKEMIKSGRRPQDNSEQMILNNFITMRHIIDMKDEPLTPDLIFQINRLVTENTLDKPEASGRLRNSDELVKVVDKLEGTIFHDPPSAAELDARMQQMCDFANGKTPKTFMHPAVRAIILHFWMGFDHPFYDGNGRTARALFYWAMLRSGYWLFQYISISSILVKAPAKYGKSFLYSETDDNDLNYFIIYQTQVVNRAIKELHAYIDRKREEVKDVEAKLRFTRELNHRQQALIMHALRHPLHEYTVESHRTSHGSAYGTARSDLLDLYEKGLLTQKTRGRTMVFSAIADLGGKLKELSARTNP